VQAGPRLAGRGKLLGTLGPWTGPDPVQVREPARTDPTPRAAALPFPAMDPRPTLVSLSSAQLCTQLAGLLVAVRRRRNFDVGFLKGTPEHVVRDSFWAGTAYSAPVTMLAAQAWATTRLRRGPDDGARRLLGMLGVMMVPGYLSERYVRQHLRTGGFDPIETPIVIASIGVAAAMGVLGHRDQAGR
jgi:hypothetical protein